MMRICTTFLYIKFCLPAVIVCVVVGSVTAHAQGYLYNSSDLVTGNYPTALTMADFNGDGILDVAVINFNANTVSVLLGKTNGSFAPKNDFGTGVRPIALVAADFNGDKKLDLAVVNENDDTVSILIGNGDGTFQAQTPYSVGNNPVGLIAGDFNSDKRIDLAVLNENDGTVAILLGNGNGTFQSQTAVSVGSTPMAIASGDFNGDHKVDVITSNPGSGTVSVLLSNGNGTFTRVDSPSDTMLPYASTLAVGDFNRDGKMDCVVTTGGITQLFFLAGFGNGTFQAPVSIPNPLQLNIGAIQAIDVNRDGRLDLVASSGPGGVAVFPGNGNGTFGAVIVSYLTDMPSSFAVADVNGDRRLDFVASNSSMNSVDVVLGDGKFHFGSLKSVALAPTSGGTDWAVAADFNGDGKLDIAVGEWNYPDGQVSVQLGKGNGTFSAPITSSLGTPGTNAGFMAPGDFNGDGKVDLAVMDSYSTGFEVLLGNGDGSFQVPIDKAFGFTAQSMTVGDFNGDGKSDVAVTTNGGSPANPSLQIYVSNGDGTFTVGALYSAPFYSRVITADVNRDGKSDLVVASLGAPLQVFLGKGDGTFNAPLSGPNLTYNSQVVAADFNGDGKTDLVVGTYNGNCFPSR